MFSFVKEDNYPLPTGLVPCPGLLDTVHEPLAVTTTAWRPGLRLVPFLWTLLPHSAATRVNVAPVPPGGKRSAGLQFGRFVFWSLILHAWDEGL